MDKTTELAKDTQAQLAEELFAQQQLRVYQRTDRFFAFLMVFQWCAGIVTALLVSPRAWEGTASSVHFHVWVAIILGGLISVFPVYLAIFQSGKTITRHVIALSQMLMSALLIHLTGGRIETHFHVFGSLAFLAFYRDWRVLITASLVVAIDHALRGLFWPQSVYGVSVVEPWRWLEHTGWVLFEDVFLAYSIRQSRKEMWGLAYRQAELEKTNQNIEAIVVERTAELDETNRKLVQSERIKDEFFANVSHELRTPLTLTLAPMETLLGEEVGSLSEEQRMLLQTMHNNSVRLLQMVSSLLDFSKLEAGKVTVKKQPTDIVGLTEAIVADCQPLAAQKLLELRFVADEKKHVIEMDHYLYERIVFNLLSNSLKFTDEGGRIVVQLKIRDANIALSVSDTGIGIATSDMTNLFQPFRQLDVSSTKRIEGTGLGLAMVKEFAELLGGNVVVESELGKGSSFLVTLPAQPCELSAEELPMRSAKVMVPRFKEMTEEIPSSEGKGFLPRVLIAEDNERLSSYMASLLTKCCNIRIAADGEEALEITNEWLPDLVLTDVMMPRRDGFSLCRQIKSNPRTSSIQVVILTALTHRDAMLQGWQAGADEYLMKPFHPTELVTRVNTLLRSIAQHKEEIQQISDLNISLEGRVLELAASNKKLENLSRQLQQARDQAVKASNYKSSFLANMSHEIRTPLNAVIGMIELLLQTPLNEQQKQLGDILSSASEVLLEVINDVLDFAKIEAGKIELNLTDFDLTMMVEETAELVAEKAQHKRISLATFIDPKLDGQRRGDATRLRQVLLNLLSNAIKFTDSGEVIVRVTCESDDGENAQVRFAVQDTGIGMSNETIQTLFQPFTQADSSVGYKYGGTGLGLSIAKLIVQLMGGEIGVDSTLSEGSTFWFVVPLSKAPHSGVSMKLPDVLKDQTVLVLAEQPGVADVLSKYLLAWQIQFDRAESYEQAITMLKEEVNHYDVAILQIQGSGESIIANLVSILKDQSRTKTIICTTGLERGLGERLLNVGFAAHLSLPFRQDKLLRCLSTLASVELQIESGKWKKRTHEQGNVRQSNDPRILVAEDNAVNQMVARLLLKELGLIADVVKTGAEAIEAVKNKDYSLVLMDCQMPELDGLEATRQIRSIEGLTGRHVPIVAMTAQAMYGDREKCLAAGMDNYVSKPVSLGQLREILAKYIPAENSTMTTTTSPQNE
jgi:signal transduction histidine kinase